MLDERKINYYDTATIAINERNNGKVYLFDEHLKGLIYSLLSNQRPWGTIQKNLHRINKIFFDFNKEKICNIEGNFFENKLKEISCGNRSIAKQMQSLKDNIKTLEQIENDYKSLDNFITSDEPRKIAKLLSDFKSKYKLKQIGLPLALEYIRNVGIDAPKPDVHILRVLSRDRINFSDCSEVSEINALETIKKISQITGYSQVYIDSLLWLFCSIDFGNICNASPKCNICKINKYCNYNKEK